jgi:hypothetical protein
MSVKLRKNKSFFGFSIATTRPLCHGCSRFGGEAPKRTRVQGPQQSHLNPTASSTLSKRMAAMAMKKKKKGKKAAKKK